MPLIITPLRLDDSLLTKVTTDHDGSVSKLVLHCFACLRTKPMQRRAIIEHAKRTGPCERGRQAQRIQEHTSVEDRHEILTVVPEFDENDQRKDDHLAMLVAYATLPHGTQELVSVDRRTRSRRVFARSRPTSHAVQSSITQTQRSEHTYRCACLRCHQGVFRKPSDPVDGAQRTTPDSTGNPQWLPVWVSRPFHHDGGCLRSLVVKMGSTMLVSTLDGAW